MLKFVAHDTENDVAIIQTNFAINVRYGLEVIPHDLDDMSGALDTFAACVRHAMECNGNLEVI